jgi:hypothetical protein
MRSKLIGWSVSTLDRRHQGIGTSIFHLHTKKKMPEIHAAHAIIFGVAPRFLSPVKKMLRVFAMLYDFLLVIRFFSRGSKKWCRRSSRERLTNFDPKIMSCAPPKMA